MKVDFGNDIIPSEVPRRKVQAHFFKGYWRDIGTIKAFFDAHMDLVQANPSFTFHDPLWLFYTRPRFLPGARLDRCDFKHVMLGEGSYVEGTSANNAVIGIRSVVHKAKLENVLIMGVDARYPDFGPDAPPVGVGEGSVIRNAIIDKNARIGRNVQIVNATSTVEAEGEGWCIKDGVVVVAKNSVIPDGTVI